MPEFSRAKCFGREISLGAINRLCGDKNVTCVVGIRYHCGAIRFETDLPLASVLLSEGRHQCAEEYQKPIVFMIGSIRSRMASSLASIVPAVIAAR
jgi:hypothetical protein